MNYYYFPQPPYLLVLVGFLIAITSGLAFEANLKQKVRKWSKDPANHRLDRSQTSELKFSFLGICLGICVFIAGGLEIFSVDRLLAYLIALPLTLFTSSLIWSQLGNVLRELELGGSKALDLDIIN